MSIETRSIQPAVDNFEFQRCLCEGRYAGTFLGKSADGSTQLMRVLRTDLVTPGWLLRMQHEVAVLSKIELPNYNAPLRCGVAGDHLYATYRWHSGQPLAKAMLNGSWPAPGESVVAATLQLAISILQALRAVHSAGCVHRDIRPTHILLNPGEEPILSGYGPLCIAEAFGRDGYEAIEFATFASPELSGSIEHDLTPASDLYSLGLVLYQTLTGKPPYVGDTMSDILFQHLTTTPTFRSIPADTPDVLVQFIDRLLAKEVRDRYQTAESALLDARAIEKAAKTGVKCSVVIGCHDQRTVLTAPTFVGRENEMSQIEDGISQVLSGGHCALIAKAKSGMGKSRLIKESMRGATRGGLAVYRSVASDQITQEPMGPLLEIVEQVAERLQSNKQALRDATVQLLQYKAEIATSMPVLAKTLGWKDARLAGPGELGQKRVALAFCKVLGFCAMDGPALVCIDDCQWLDNPSLKVLSQFAKQSPASTGLLLGTRPNEGNSERLVKQLPSATTMEFGPLSTAETCDLIESMAGKLPSAIKSAVVAMAQGSPFMATAAMRGLVESNVLSPKQGQWAVNNKQLAEFQTASDSASILLKRLEFLEPIALRILSIGAIAGKQFDASIPIALTGRSPESVFSTMDAICGQGLIWFRPDGTVAFSHDKVRETLITRMSLNDRQEMHRLVAEYLSVDQPQSHFDLAHHFSSAGQPHLAWRPALSAAKIARKRYALDSAESQYRIAAQAIDSDECITKLDQASRYAIESGLAESLLMQGKYSEAERWLKESLATATTPFEIANIRLQQGELEFKRGDKKQAVERFEKALGEAGHPIPSTQLRLLLRMVKETAVQAVHTWVPSLFVGRHNAPSEAQRLVWRLYSRLAHGYWCTHDRYWTLWAHLRGINLAERYEDTPEMAQAYSDHAPCMSLIPWYRRGLKYASRSLAIRETNSDPWGEGQSRNSLGVVLYSGSAYEKCLEQSQQAIGLLERTGDNGQIHMAKFQAAASMYRLGRLKEATNAARGLYESAIKLGDNQVSGYAVDLWSRASLGQVPADIIRQEAQRPSRDHQGDCQVWLAAGVRHHMAERYDKAIQYFQKSVSAVRDTGVLNAYISPNFCWLATSKRCQLEMTPSKSKQVRRQQIRELGRAARNAIWVALRFRNDMPHAMREYAAYLAMTGRLRRAIWLLRRSIAMATSQNASYEAALSELMLAEILAESKTDCSKTQTQLDNAKQIVNSFEKAVTRGTTEATLSLIERFESLLDSGQQISDAQSTGEVLERTSHAAKTLLRGEKTLIVQEVAPNHISSAARYQCVGPHGEFDADLVHKANESGNAIVQGVEKRTKHGVTSEQTGAFLCCPIPGVRKYFLYVANTRFINFYGKDELKIASYLSSAAVNALQRCASFEQLEQRVVERTRDVVERSKELERTARKLTRTKDQLKEAKEKAEKASSSKSEFLACMSHEIRTPMTAVLGFAEILINRAVDPEDYVRYLRRIQSNGVHLLSLLNDVLDFSKIEAGRMDIEQVFCRPYDLVQDAVTAIESRAKSKDIGLILKVEGEIPEFIQTDPTRLRQIVTNLVGNAIKFTSEGGVCVTVRLDNAAQLPKLEIEVADTGIGISPVQYRQIFAPFSQADASTTRCFGGTGLGLTISKRLSEALAGDLYVASEVGKGSTFVASVGVGDISSVNMLDAKTVSLARDRQPQSKRKSVSLAGMNVLVVDDIEANRELVGFLVKGSNAHVTYAVNGREAVDLVVQKTESAFDLILMDMQMPVLDGYQATQEIRQSGVLTPIVALTANNVKGDSEKCLAIGCDAFLSKPIDFDLLLETVEKYHQREQAAPLAQAKPNETTQSYLAQVEPIRESRVESDSADPDSNVASDDDDDQLQSLLLKLRQEFSQTILDRMPELTQAIENQDTDILLEMTHWLRGTSGTIGMCTIAELVDAIDSNVKQNQFLELPKIAAQITAEAKETISC